jgi:Heparinase II/III-like protein/Heparinase II/III N-terminus
MRPALAPKMRQHKPAIRVRLDPEFSSRAVLDDMMAGQFSALGERHALGTPVDFSHNPSDDIEWLIILNKFYHAPGLVQAWIETRDRRYLDLWKVQTRRWIETMEPGFIAADVTGRRVQNWVYALSLWEEDGADFDPEFRTLVDRSIAEQLEWLRENLHPSRNHRTLELLALLLGAVWLGHDPDWVLTALANNAAEDFLPDGVHAELSSHYHCIVLRNFLDAIDLARDNGISVQPNFLTTVEKASHFANVLHKPDGLIPALSDADVGDYRDMLGPRAAPSECEVFADAGYVILRDAAAALGDRDGHYLVFDCGPLGAGNHGHLDCLSFEFAALGRSLIVDPGRYTYFEGGPVNERAAFRGTAAHNVVQVDQLEQTAYAQGPSRMKIAGPAPDATLLRAEARCVHARMASHEYDVVQDRIVVRGDGWWIIHDRLTSPSEHDYALRFQLSPEAQDHVHRVEFTTGAKAFLSPELMVVPLASNQAEFEIEPAWVSPTYGIRHSAPRLKITQRAADAWFSTLLLPLAGAMPEVGFAADTKGYCLHINGDPHVAGEWPC